MMSDKKLARLKHINDKLLMRSLIKSATENCKNERVLHWLRENSESEAFYGLVYMYDFLKKHIDEEEKKNHGSSVHITFVAHGAIRDSMIFASCLLPLSTITDVLLYSPWNCSMDADAVYGVATGLIKPQHRVFKTKKHAQIPNGVLTKLPNYWNSMKKAGDQMIPNITLSPLKPQEGIWTRFETLTKKHGGPESNRIVIPFILPAGSDCCQRVPLFVVTMALSLVLLSSRFHATVHLAACLNDHSDGHKFDKDYLKIQYACTTDNVTMTSSPDMFLSWFDGLKRFFGF